MSEGPGIKGQESFLLSLRAETEAFRDFVALLESERAALATGDADRLISIAQAKAAKVATLGKLAEERNRYLLSATGLSDQHGLDAWQQQQDASGRTRAMDLWQQLLELARSAKRLNEENGALIGVSLQHNQRALAVLRGAATQATNLYGADGQVYTSTSGRPLGKA
jgi:flagella synthesis protein FlgN